MAASSDTTPPVSTCGPDCECKQEDKKMGEGTYVQATDNLSYTYTPTFTGYTYPTTGSATWTSIPIVPAPIDYDERARSVLLSIALDSEESTEDRIHAACSLLTYGQ